jgi:Protein of unknown function (DUF4065)
MPLFKLSDPDLRSLIAYLVARSRERDVTLNQTKLVKLLYLVDVERVATGRTPLTGLRWRFFHYGPYALELPETLDAMEGSEIVTRVWNGATLYVGAPSAPSGDDWPSGTRRLVDGVVRRFGSLDLDELLDHVYFHTGPMVGAQRGDELELERARTWREPPRPRPLLPPPTPPELDSRLSAWRQRSGEWLADVRLEPPGRLYDDAEMDLGGGVTGRLAVPEDTPPL